MYLVAIKYFRHDLHTSRLRRSVRDPQLVILLILAVRAWYSRLHATQCPFPQLCPSLATRQ